MRESTVTIFLSFKHRPTTEGKSSESRQAQGSVPYDGTAAENRVLSLHRKVAQHDMMCGEDSKFIEKYPPRVTVLSKER